MDRDTLSGILLIWILAMAAGLGLTHEWSQAVTKEIYQRPSNKQLKKRPQPRHQGPVVVAVIDTGIDFTHPRLRGRSVPGFDFVDMGQGGKDPHGHGTHIAGIIASHAPEALMMDLRYFSREIDGDQALRNSLKAMRFAIDHQVDIINYSGGGTVANSQEEALLREAVHKGILIVAAAGNEGSDSSRTPFYPANYRLPNIISVTAVDDQARGVQFVKTSNYGPASVTVAAQGMDVESTLPGGKFGLMTGTSQATAFVTAAAALLLARSREEGSSLAPEELIERLTVAARQDLNLVGRTRFASTLAVDRALEFRNWNPRPESRELVESFENAVSNAGHQSRIER